MKLAIIPPLCFPYKAVVGSDNYKLILPAHWQNNGHFQATMLNHRRGGFTILDNGVAENEKWSFGQLLEIARRYFVQEVVLPDVLGDAKATKDAVESVMDQLDMYGPHGYMGVVQGTTFAELRDLCDFYGGLQGAWGVQCIGIPRHLLSLDWDMRYRVASYVRSRDSRINIHLLGTNPEHMSELRDLGELFCKLDVRGVDTSAPFVYAQNHLASWIGSDNVIRRPEGYFDMERTDFNGRVLQQNIDTLRAWVNG